MKIIHLCNYFQPQLGYQEYFLAREHARMNHEVTVVTSDRYFPFPDYYNTVKKILGERFVGRGESMLDGFRVIRLKTIFEFSARVLLSGLSKAIKSVKPDIVVCHGMATFNSQIIINLKKKLNFKLIYDDHMLFSEENKTILGKLFYKFFNFKRISMNADRLAGVSAECVDFMVQKYKFRRNEIEMIPLGADADLFKYDEGLRTRFREKHNIEENSIVVVYTGKLTYKKGPHNILLAADKIVNKTDKKIVLLFVGDFENNYREFFKSIKNKLDKSVTVINLAAVKNNGLVEIYSSSDIAVWPRQGSMSMIEASSCSVPIICCDFLKERYKNDNGIPIKEDDIDDLAGAILKLVKDDRLRVTMGDNGRELIENEMSWRIIAEQFISFPDKTP